MVHIRKELPEDIPAIRRVNRQAFGENTEADLVNQLRENGALTLSLVALAEGKVVGHIAFSPVRIVGGAGEERNAIGLAPMAVLPEHQRKGLGSKLIREAFPILRKRGHTRVVVLGHPEYYPRFGFIPADQFGIRWEHDCPAEAFMVKELEDGAFDGITGIVKFRPEFEEV